MRKKVLAVAAVLLCVLGIVLSNATTNENPELWSWRRRTRTPTPIRTTTLVPSLTLTPSATVTITPTPTQALPGTPIPGKVMKCYLVVEVDGERRPEFEFRCPSSIYYYSPGQ